MVELIEVEIQHGPEISEIGIQTFVSDQKGVETQTEMETESSVVQVTITNNFHFYTTLYTCSLF